MLEKKRSAVQQHLETAKEIIWHFRKSFHHDIHIQQEEFI